MLTFTGMAVAACKIAKKMQKPIAPTLYKEFGYCEISNSGRIKSSAKS